MICEIIGQTSFNPNRGKCCKIFGLIGFFIALPVILLIFCLIGGFGIALVSMTKLKIN